MTQTPSLAEVRQRARNLSLRAAQLHGAQQASQARHDELIVKVGEANGRRALAKEIKQAFTALQARAHARSVGAFERLLTALVEDVMPNEGQIKLIPKFRDNTTWLDVMKLDQDLNLEDVLDDNGGALTNIVSAGLRFAALNRTKNRRFMVLDEPDCWIQPMLIPALIRVVAQVAEQTRTQTLFISHYDKPEEFEGLVTVVRMTVDENDVPSVHVVGEPKHVWKDDNEPGIRGVELFNVRRHHHTYIPCFPGGMALVGPNNKGKSTLLSTPFRAMAFGETSESMIRHKQKEARIVIHLEERKRLELVRKRTGSPAVIYRMFEGDNEKPLHEGAPDKRGAVPYWVTQALGVSKVDDIDIQIGRQKAPIFLLNESAAKRASILSMGRESGHLASMMKLYESISAEDTSTINKGEEELTKLKARLAALNNVPSVISSLEILSEMVEDATAAQASVDRRKSVIDHLVAGQHRVARAAATEKVLAGLPELPAVVDTAPISAKVRELDAVATRVRRATVQESILGGLPELPSLSDSSRASNLANQISRSEKLVAKLNLRDLPSLPEVKDTSRLIELGRAIKFGEIRVAAIGKLPKELPSLPDVRDTAGHSKAVDRLMTSQARVTASSATITDASQEFDEADAAFKELKAELGVCPLCESSLAEGQGHAIHHH